ncbi:MAG: PA14 domain-containing protein, partial [Polyangiales bacterium]
LLERAMERPWFGWGTYCRACLFEPWSGDLSSTRDGEWIIQLGDSGIVGFASRFGLMLFPLLLLLRRLRFVPRDSDRRLLGGLGLMIGFAAFDMVPNADFSRLAFILSGALLGCLTGILQEASLMRLKKRQARIAAARQAPNARAAGLAGAATLFGLLLAAPVAAAAPDAVGGGFADSGLDASYYANPDLEGTPSFTRRDLRIDFDWDELRPVGGSTAEPYRWFPRDGFSIRWSGRIIPRFSEAYTFHGEADDGIRIKIRAPGESTWTSLVDRWSEAGAFESKPFQMRAGELYELQVEYRELEGRAACRPLWKSQSAAAEVIDPVRQQGISQPSGRGMSGRT